MKVVECAICEGGLVLLKLHCNRKDMPEWDPKPYFVRAVKNSMTTAQQGEQVLARNSSFFKRFNFENTINLKPTNEFKKAERSVETQAEEVQEETTEAAA